MRFRAFKQIKSPKSTRIIRCINAELPATHFCSKVILQPQTPTITYFSSEKSYFEVEQRSRVDINSKADASSTVLPLEHLEDPLNNTGQHYKYC